MNKKAKPSALGSLENFAISARADFRFATLNALFFIEGTVAPQED